MSAYQPADIEKKWQLFWEQDNTFATPATPGAKKKYILDMFPYPSGSGLHVGHPEGYTATDILARCYRAKGFDVLHPMGWDAFGLPAEQHAIDTGTHPRDTTVNNIDNFRRQLKMLGFSYDWSREVDTTDPDYVRWTQWIFLQLFNKELAFQSEITVNWCPALGTVLANEEVIDGRSERGGHPVERRPLRQWMLRITAYADSLLKGLEGLDWPKSTKTMQEEWIGRSEGAEVEFNVDGHDEKVNVFTTRPDTLFGATFIVLAPEHSLVQMIMTDEQRGEVDAYVARAKNKSDRDRQAAKEKTGVFTGAYAINPVDGAKVAIWIADYVMMGYGTGAIMAVPAHDVRDFEFAKKFGIDIIQVVSPDGKKSDLERAFAEHGIAVNSGKYDGMKTAEMKSAIIAELEEKKVGCGRVEFKLRDWVFSRQRYWGEPIPIYFPMECAGDPRKGDDYTIDFDSPIALEESELPLQLPELEDYRPGEDPQGVLARALDWRFFQRDGKWFARETNTMPQWAGSCWYYLRYIDPKNSDMAFSDEAQSWLPVDLYVGGAEHAVLHLLYARFWHQVLFDSGHIREREPFQKLVHQGMILGPIEYTKYTLKDGTPISRSEVKKNEDGEWIRKSDQSAVDANSIDAISIDAISIDEGAVQKLKNGSFALAEDASIVVDARAHKMSKSRGNVINPDDVVNKFGADTLRLYEMFMGPLEATKPWNTQAISGVRRFLDKAYALTQKERSGDEPNEALERLRHRTIRKVDEDFEGLRFNTSISALMVYVGECAKQKVLPKICLETLALLLHPLAPHMGEEIWQLLGNEGSVQRAEWPAFDPAKCEESEKDIPVQVNGKKRGVVRLANDASEEVALSKAKEIVSVQNALSEGQIRKVIWVPGRILNLIVK